MGAGKRRLSGNVALAAILALLFLGIYGSVVAQNIGARRRVHAACEAIREGHERWMRSPVVPLMFGVYAEGLARDTRDEWEAQCAFLEGKLSWWRFNIGVYAQVPIDEARRARKREAFAEAEKRCPEVIRSSMAALQLPEKEALSTAGQICGLVTTARQQNELPSKPVLLWEWPAQLEPIARGMSPAAPPSGSAR